MEQTSQIIRQLQASGIDLGGLAKLFDDFKVILIIAVSITLGLWLLGIISDLIQRRSISKIRREVKEINRKLDILLAQSDPELDEPESD